MSFVPALNRLPVPLLIFTLAVFLLGGCAGGPDFNQSTARQAELLSEALDGTAALGRRYRPDELPSLDILGLDAEMKDFVAEHVLPNRSKTSRLAHLLRAVLGPDELGLKYGEQHTKTASDAFHHRQANCLAFSNLFVALARESGLQVSYQDVLVSPQWEMMEGSMTLRRHVNVQVEMSRRFVRVVDISPNRNRLLQLESIELSDEQAFAQFYNNLAMDYLHAKNYQSAFLYIRKALLLDPNAAFIWSNFGVILSRFDKTEHAEAALLHARELDPAESAATSNLLRIYSFKGDTEKIDYYRNELTHYQNRNPYYLLLKARKAYFNKDFVETVRLLKRAVSFKPDEELMHELKARAHAELGQAKQAKKALKQAVRFAKSSLKQEEYRSRLEQMQTGSAAEEYDDMREQL